MLCRTPDNRRPKGRSHLGSVRTKSLYAHGTTWGAHLFSAPVARPAPFFVLLILGRGPRKFRTMKTQVYQVLHVISVILLFAVTFSGFAAPQPHRRRRIMAASGILALVVLVTGFGLISTVYANHFAGWMFVKMAAWLVVAALAGAAFRQPARARLFVLVTALTAFVAVLMVYLKPFTY